MMCPMCGGSIKKDHTNLPLEFETGLLYLKNVPAEICNQCGEVFVSDSVAGKLEDIVSKAKKQKVEIEVVSYQDAA